jgi:transposase
MREETPMIRIDLSEEARQELVETFKTTGVRHLRDRCQAVLMKADQRPQKEIACDLPVDCRSVYNWLMAYLSGGLEGLKIQWGMGAKSLIPEELVPRIQEWVKQGPAGCGFNRANWTYAE